MLKPVTIAVPATTANLGPGFDCLGMALDIWNYVQFHPGQQPRVEVIGEGEGRLTPGQSNMVFQAAQRYFQETGMVPPQFSITCHNHIPLARGLGSSSAAIAGGILGACLMSGATPEPEVIWKIAVATEGHPDNVTPALFGGCQIVVTNGNSLVRAPVSLPEGIKAVLFIPDQPMGTRKARNVVPQRVSLKDAVFNSGRVGLLVNALAAGRLDDLRVATQDRLHQPARQAIFPAMKPLFQSALDGGALGVFLSGAGSTVLALTKGNEVTVAREMEDGANKAGVKGSVKITQPSLQGAHATVDSMVGAS